MAAKRFRPLQVTPFRRFLRNGKRVNTGIVIGMQTEYIAGVTVRGTDSREHRVALVHPVSPVQLVLLQVGDQMQVFRQRHFPAQHAPFQTAAQVIATPLNEPNH